MSGCFIFLLVLYHVIFLAAFIPYRFSCQFYFKSFSLLVLFHNAVISVGQIRFKSKVVNAVFHAWFQDKS